MSLSVEEVPVSSSATKEVVEGAGGREGYFRAFIRRGVGGGGSSLTHRK